MRYTYYLYNKQSPANIIVDSCFILKKRKPALCDSYNIIAFFFSKLRNVDFMEYTYEHNGIVIAKAYIMGRLPIFRFMPKNGIHIGHCWTHYNYRGLNLYPALITHILNDYNTRHNTEENQRPIYIFTADTNIASQRGISKTNVFQPIAQGYRRCRFYWSDTNL